MHPCYFCASSLESNSYYCISDNQRPSSVWYHHIFIVVRLYCDDTMVPHSPTKERESDQKYRGMPIHHTKK